MTRLPTGTVTFLFTDIEGSTNLARKLGDRWPDVLEEHNAILRMAIRDHGGLDVRTEGDAFFAVFTSAPAAVAAAAEAQRSLAEHAWPEDGHVRVRIGVHTGEGRLGGDEYVGLDVHRAARIAAAGHGGQVLISDATKALVADKVPDGVSLRTLGEHRLKDFDDPQPIHQLVIDGLPGEFPSLKTLEVPTNLPTALTTFVGRERELEELDALLARRRLVTLIGPGGTGKTRLALEAAARRTERHRDGVFFVDLSPVRDPEQVPSSLVKGLGLKEQPGRPAMEALVEHLSDQRSLLLMDNFEQVIPAAPHVGQILHAPPQVHVLATSRIRLGLAGEQEFPVPPLGVPETGSDLDVLAQNDAVALFLDRARAARPSFELTEGNAPAVAAICARLDGLPLAIELAAAQLRVLAPNELLGRLDQRLPLRAGTADVPERQRTLRSTIEWSYDLLAAPHRAFFGRLAVFGGGASFAAVESVCNPAGDLGIDTLDALASLVDQSLVRREESSEGSRYSMLETIREYAAERLQAEFDAEDTGQRHAEFFALLVEEWGPRVRSGQAPAATSILGLDYGNVREALAWSIRRDRADIGLRVAAPMWMYWVEHGPLEEGRRATQELVALPSARADQRLRARGMSALGSLAYWKGDYRLAQEAYEEALAIYRDLEDPRGTAESLINLAYLAGAQRQYARVHSVIEEAVDIARRAGLRREAAEAAGLLGLARSSQGDHEGALAASREALEGFEAEGDLYRANEVKSRIGAIYLQMGRVDEADAHLRESLAERGEVPGAVGMVTMNFLAAVASSRGDHHRSLRLFGFAQAVTERMGTSPPIGLFMQYGDLINLSMAAVDQRTAEELVAEGKAMSEEEAVAYALEEPA